VRVRIRYRRPGLVWVASSARGTFTFTSEFRLVASAPMLLSCTEDGECLRIHVHRAEVNDTLMTNAYLGVHLGHDCDLFQFVPSRIVLRRSAKTLPSPKVFHRLPLSALNLEYFVVVDISNSLFLHARLVHHFLQF
jgi:hypothetical protein